MRTANIHLSNRYQDSNRTSFSGADREGDSSTNETSAAESAVRDRNLINQRKIELIEVYNSGAVKRKNENTLRTLSKEVRKVIIPKMKFVKAGQLLGSFECPDFTDEKCWVNALFGNIPNLKSASDRVKGEVWMTYRKNIKEQFSLHRSAVTLRIKDKFLKGKLIVVFVVVNIEMLYLTFA